MTMTSLHKPSMLNLVLSLSVALLLGACASPAVDQARQLGKQGQHEAALTTLRHALTESPNDRRLQLAYATLQEEAVNELVPKASVARSAGKLDEVRAVLSRLDSIAPQHPRTASIRQDLERIKRLERLLDDARQAFSERAYERAEAALRSLLAEDAGNRRARDLLDNIEALRAQQTRQQSTLSLAASQQPVTLEFREAPLKNVFEALSRAANINFVFDKDVRGESKVTLFLRNTSVEEAMRVIFSTQQLGSKLLNDNTVLVFPGTQQKQRELLDTVTRSFYLTNADTKQAQTLIRTVAKTRDIYADERLNMLVVRDTPEVMRLIERLIQSLDLPDPEVMLELEVMEVSTKTLDQVGINWPEAVNYGVPGSTAPIALSSPLPDSLRYYVPNPLAIVNLKSTRGATNLLANPKIRARNREKAKVLLGEKLPIFTTTSTANVGVSASVTYLDVGLKLEVEPQILLDNDVAIKVALEVSSITDKVLGPQGSIAYQVGTRQASTTLRLRDGETQILAGLINDNESRSSAGIPGLHNMPIAGRLFGSTTDSKEKTEVILLITPHIVRNLVQPASAVSLMPSGTEAQPGAASLLLRKGVTARSGAQGTAASLPSAAAGRGAGVTGSTAAAPAVNLSGPEEVLPGASFQVSVRNPTNQPFSAVLLIDSGVLEMDMPGGGQGSSTSISVPPNGIQTVTMRVKPGLRSAETMVTLDGGAEPLRLRVRDPSSPDGAPSQENPDADEPASDLNR